MGMGIRGGRRAATALRGCVAAQRGRMPDGHVMCGRGANACEGNADVDVPWTQHIRRTVAGVHGGERGCAWRPLCITWVRRWRDVALSPGTGVDTFTHHVMLGGGANPCEGVRWLIVRGRVGCHWGSRRQLHCAGDGCYVGQLQRMEDL
jgi:hypothetical protein